MVKKRQMIDIHRTKCSISLVGRKWKLNPNGDLVYNHQISKQLRNLTVRSADVSVDEGIAYALWNVCALVPQHWKVIWFY